MSEKLPSLTGSEIVKALKKGGFLMVRIRVSHHFMRHPDRLATVVPVHAGETIGPGLLSKILRDSGLSKDEFRELLD